MSLSAGALSVVPFCVSKKMDSSVGIGVGGTYTRRNTVYHIDAQSMEVVKKRRSNSEKQSLFWQAVFKLESREKKQAWLS